jgi:hypothetical protein
MVFSGWLAGATPFRLRRIGSGLNEVGGSHNAPMSPAFCHIDTFKALPGKTDLRRGQPRLTDLHGPAGPILYNRR